MTSPNVPSPEESNHWLQTLSEASANTPLSRNSLLDLSGHILRLEIGHGLHSGAAALRFPVEYLQSAPHDPTAADEFATTPEAADLILTAQQRLQSALDDETTDEDLISAPNITAALNLANGTVRKWRGNGSLPTVERVVPSSRGYGISVHHAERQAVDELYRWLLPGGMETAAGDNADNGNKQEEPWLVGATEARVTLGALNTASFVKLRSSLLSLEIGHNLPQDTQRSRPTTLRYPKDYCAAVERELQTADNPQLTTREFAASASGQELIIEIEQRLETELVDAEVNDRISSVDLCRILNISPATLTAWRKAGILPEMTDRTPNQPQYLGPSQIKHLTKWRRPTLPQND